MKPRNRRSWPSLVFLSTLLTSSCGPWHSRQSFTETRPGRPAWVEKSRIARSKKSRPAPPASPPKDYPDPKVDVPLLNPD